MGTTVAVLKAVIQADLTSLNSGLKQGTTQINNFATTASDQTKRVEKGFVSLQTVTGNLRREIALMGNDTRAASVRYDVMTGSLKNVTAEEKTLLITLARQADALEAQQLKTAKGAAQWEAMTGRLKQYTQVVGTVVLTTILGLGKTSFDAAVRIENLETALTAVTGGTQRMKAELVALTIVAKNPGLGFNETVKGALRLQSAGLSLETATKLLTGFGNAIALAGKGREALDFVTLALSQMAAKGKIAGDDLRQIADQVPQIRQILKDAFGTADTEILEKAQIPIQKLMDMLADATNALPKMGDSLQNTLTNAADTVDKSMARMGKAITPVAKLLLDKFMPGLDAASKGVEAYINHDTRQAFINQVKAGDKVETGLSVSDQMAALQAAKAEYDKQFKANPTAMSYGGGGILDVPVPSEAAGNQYSRITNMLARLKEEYELEQDQARRLGAISRERSQYDKIDAEARAKAIEAVKKAIEKVGSASDLATLNTLLTKAKSLINEVPILGKGDTIKRELLKSLSEAKQTDLESISEKNAKEAHAALVDLIIENEKALKGHVATTHLGALAWDEYARKRKAALELVPNQNLKEIAKQTAVEADAAVHGAAAWKAYTTVLDAFIKKRKEVQETLNTLLTGGQSKLTNTQQFDVNRKTPGTNESKLTQAGAAQARNVATEIDNLTVQTDRLRNAYKDIAAVGDLAGTAMAGIDKGFSDLSSRSLIAGHNVQELLADKAESIQATIDDMLMGSGSKSARLKQALETSIQKSIAGTMHTMSEYQAQIDYLVNKQRGADLLDEYIKAGKKHADELKAEHDRQIAEVDRYANQIGGKVSGTFVDTFTHLRGGIRGFGNALENDVKSSVEDIIQSVAKDLLTRLIARALSGQALKLLHLDQDGTKLKDNSKLAFEYMMKGALAIGIAASQLLSAAQAVGNIGSGGTGGSSDSGGSDGSTSISGSFPTGGSSSAGYGRYAAYLQKYGPAALAGVADYAKTHDAARALGAGAGAYFGGMYGGPLGSAVGAWVGDKVGSQVSKAGNWLKKHLGFRTGGSFAAGQDFIAGEDGPEVIRAKSSGRVYNARETQEMLSASGGGVNAHYTIYGGIHNAADLESLHRGVTQATYSALVLGVNG